MTYKLQMSNMSGPDVRGFGIGLFKYTINKEQTEKTMPFSSRRVHFEDSRKEKRSINKMPNLF